MRYRIVIVVETEQGRDFVNKLALHCFDETVTKESNPVYLSTEKVDEKAVHVNRY